MHKRSTILLHSAGESGLWFASQARRVPSAAGRQGGASMKVKIDADLCTACGLCTDSVPQVFKMGKDVAEVIAADVPANLGRRGEGRGQRLPCRGDHHLVAARRPAAPRATESTTRPSRPGFLFPVPRRRRSGAGPSRRNSSTQGSRRGGFAPNRRARPRARARTAGGERFGCHVVGRATH